MAWSYSDKTKELFMAAVQGQAGTHLGEIANPDGFGEHGSIACGDALRFTFRVERDPDDATNDRIVEARYLTFGCTSAIASSEALCQLIEEGGFSPIQALEITNDDIVRFVGGLPAEKVHCSVMGAEALQAAVFNWSQKRGIDLAELGVQLDIEDKEDGRIVCKCFTLSEPYLKRKIRELELHSIEEITNAVKAGGACTTCHHTPGGLQDLLDEVWGPEPTRFKECLEFPTERLPVIGEQEVMSSYQFAKKIERVLDDEVRPMLKTDGGDLELVDIKGTLVYCSLQGACSSCPGAAQTLKLMVEKSLKDKVDQRIRVISV
jgi:NifU-like protein